MLYYFLIKTRRIDACPFSGIFSWQGLHLHFGLGSTLAVQETGGCDEDGVADVPIAHSWVFSGKKNLSLEVISDVKKDSFFKFDLLNFFFVIDSVAALVPQAEIDGEMGDSHVGLQARLMSQALRKLSGTINKTNTTCIFINQLREKVGVMFGNPETTPGGRALKFYSSVRLDIRRNEQLKMGDGVVGNKTTVKVVKNKVAPPFKTAVVDIMYGEGVSREGEIIDLAVEASIVDKTGAWYAYNGEKLGQGKENVKLLLKENVELRDEIEQKVREYYDISLKKNEDNTSKK